MYYQDLPKNVQNKEVTPKANLTSALFSFFLWSPPKLNPALAVVDPLLVGDGTTTNRPPGDSILVHGSGHSLPSLESPQAQRLHHRRIILLPLAAGAKTFILHPILCYVAAKIKPREHDLASRPMPKWWQAINSFADERTEKIR